MNSVVWAGDGNMEEGPRLQRSQLARKAGANRLRQA